MINLRQGLAGKWLAKDGDNEIKVEFKVEGSKLTGTLRTILKCLERSEFKDGKIEGDKISFSYVRQMNGQDMKISWTGTLSGDEIKLKRDAARRWWNARRRTWSRSESELS